MVLDEAETIDPITERTEATRPYRVNLRAVQLKSILDECIWRGPLATFGGASRSTESLGFWHGEVSITDKLDVWLPQLPRIDVCGHDTLRQMVRRVVLTHYAGVLKNPASSHVDALPSASINNRPA